MGLVFLGEGGGVLWGVVVSMDAEVVRCVGDWEVGHGLGGLWL